MNEDDTKELHFLRALLAGSWDVTWVFDEGGLVTYASPNRAGGRALPAPIGELSLEHFVAAAREDERDKLRAAFALARRSPPDCPIFVDVHAVLDGAHLDRECVVLNRLDDPDIRGILVQTHDIGHTNDARRAMLDAERRFRVLFQGTSSAVTIRDVATQTLLDCNDAALRMYGAKTVDDMREFKPSDLAPPMQPDGTSSIEGMRRSVEHANREGWWAGQWLARRLNGETFTARIRISKIDMDDGAVFQSIVEDVSDLMRAREDAMAASRAKSAFLATMSHELRSPLSAVIGMVELLSRTSLDERQRHYAEVALGSARGLLSIIGDILDFSKIEAGKLEIRFQRFRLPDVLDEAVSVLALAAKERGIVLAWTIDPGLDAPLLGDAARIRQVLVNLIGNAVKFTDRGSVRVRALASDVSVGRLRLRIEVEDTGSGIAPEDVERIFAPFAQADSQETRRRGGTGLGLAICREIAEGMGGTIGVESVAGRGSTFWFEVRLDRSPDGPLATASTDADRTWPAIDPAPAFSGAKVLVVDDSAPNAEVTGEILVSAGYEVVIATSGEKALADVTTDAFDLVLLDRHLPGIDGHETARRIRSLEKDGRTRSRGRLPIVALTATATIDDSELSRDAGMDDHISKPIERERLLQIAARHVNASRSGSSPPPPRRCPVDLARALARVGGEKAILRRATVGFLEIAPSSWDLLQAAVKRRDRATVGFTAHRLRGQASMFDALDLVDALRAVEELAETELWTSADAIVARTEEAMREAIVALEGASRGG